MSELPKGWVITTLDCAAAWGSGGTPNRANPNYYGGNIPWIKTGELGQSTIDDTDEKLTDAGLQNSSAKLFPAGSVAIAMYGATIGKASILGIQAATNQACAVGAPVDGITISKYLYYYLLSQKKYFVEAGKGGAQPNISQTLIKSWPIPLAPFPEQKRTVDKLDTLLARNDACRDRLDRIPKIIKQFRQSVLAAATSGRLTEDWRAAQADRVARMQPQPESGMVARDAAQGHYEATPATDAVALHPGYTCATTLANLIHASHQAVGGHKTGNAAAPTEDVHDLSPEMFPQSWVLITLRDVVQPNRPITYGILKPGPEIDDGVSYIRVADFPRNKLNLATIRKTSKSMDEEFKRSRLSPGDLLISIRGTVGRIIVIPTELNGANITQDSARLSIQPFVNSRFVYWYLQSPMAQDRMKGSTKGVAVRGINIGDVRALQLPLPSRSEQDEIVRRVENLFALADRLETRVATARARGASLTPSTLAKAFRGELVPQDPNDEPASALLERIRAERAGKPPARRSGRGPAKSV